MAADLNSLVRLTKAEIKPASEMFARAFHDDPLLIYFLPDAAKRKNVSHYIFELRVRLGVTYGEVYATSPNLEGVAVWLFSEGADAAPWRRVRGGGSSLSSKIGEEAYSRRRSFGDYASSLHKRHAPFPHWYLALMGVDPAFQGKGYAGILLKAMLSRVDREHLPCYLETQTEKNVAIYRHYGFEVVEEDTVPGTGVTNWAMLRE